MTTKVCGRTWVNGAWRVACGLQGPKWTRLVVFDDGGLLRVKRLRGHVPMKPLADYNASTMARAMRQRGVRRMSKGARQLLRQLR